MGNPSLVIHWTSLVRKRPQNEGFTKYVNRFMSTAYTIIHEEVPPRLFPEFKKLLQLSLDTKVGDWYLFQNHTEIRIYGSEAQPFLLPVFLTMRIFSLEYIRQRLNLIIFIFLQRNKR
jgi:hypothetical protein